MVLGSGGLKGPYAFLIIGLMILGVIAGAFYFYHPTTQANPCGSPGKPEFSTPFDYPINSPSYKAVAANFTGEQQSFVLNNVTFLTVTFSDPSQPHLVGGTCTTDTSTPVSITLQATFKDGTSQALSIQYRGSPGIASPTSAYSTHKSPQAGVTWQSGNNYILLLVSL